MGLLVGTWVSVLIFHKSLQPQPQLMKTADCSCLIQLQPVAEKLQLNSTEAQVDHHINMCDTSAFKLTPPSSANHTNFQYYSTSLCILELFPQIQAQPFEDQISQFWRNWCDNDSFLHSRALVWPTQWPRVCPLQLLQFCNIQILFDNKMPFNNQVDNLNRNYNHNTMTMTTHSTTTRSTHQATWWENTPHVPYQTRHS